MSKGTFKLPRPTMRVDLEDDLTGAWVDMLINVPSAASDALYAHAKGILAAQEEGEQASYYPAPALRPAIARLIVAWNLLHPETGEPLPATSEGLAELDWGTINAIVGAWYAQKALPKSNGTASSAPSAAKARPPSGTPTLSTVAS